MVKKISARELKVRIEKRRASNAKALAKFHENHKMVLVRVSNEYSGTLERLKDDHGSINKGVKFLIESYHKKINKKCSEF
jgi:hypothetical protein